MHPGRTIFSQIMDFMPRREFSKSVTRYRGNYKVQKFTCQEQFRCMAFTQLTNHGECDISNELSYVTFLPSFDTP